MSTRCNFIDESSNFARKWQRNLDSLEPEKNLILRVVRKSISGFADVFIDTIKTPMQSLEHAKAAVEQLFYARTSGQGYCYNQGVFGNIPNPSHHSVKGSLFYAESAVSHAIFTVPTTILAVAKLVHQLGGHFFYTEKTYSIGLTEKKDPAWTPASPTKAIITCRDWQNHLYDWTRSFTDKSHRKPDHISPRLLSPFIAGADVVLDTVSPLAATIETVSNTVGHLFGALTWQKGYSLRGVITRTDQAFFKASQTVSACVFMIPKFLQKTCAILHDPEHAYSIRAFSSINNYEKCCEKNNPNSRFNLRYV